MIGITSYGAYVPFYRLDRKDIAAAWGRSALPGEKAVANYDEDSITMSVAAVLDCLGSADPGVVDGLHFASTTSPYKEKQSAALVALAADMPRRMLASDFTDSLRAGTLALRAAVDAVRANSAQKVMVVAADCRPGVPQSEQEQLFGDGAAAFLIGNTDVITEIEATYSHSDEIIDVWRTDTDVYTKSWEDRFVLSEGYARNMREAISNIMKENELTVKDIDKAVFYAPDPRRHMEMARSVGFDVKAQVQEPLLTSVSNTGAAFAMMMLVAALEESKPGDRILFANYGNGADAYILRVTEHIESIPARRGIKGHLASKMMIGYEKYLNLHQILFTEGERRREAPNAFAPVMWREREQLISFHGSQCRHCGRIFHPMQRVCIYCGTKDEYDGVRLSNRKGTLFTYCLDHLAFGGDPPTAVCKVHLEGPVGVYCLMTDRDPNKVELGMSVEMTFRKMHDSGGMHTYYWKCRPMR